MHTTQLQFSPMYFYLEYIAYRSEHMQQSAPPPRVTSAKVKYVLMSQKQYKNQVRPDLQKLLTVHHKYHLFNAV
jgi:hypothetical protein